MVLDTMLADIQALGVEGISRSALGRYVPVLKAEDEFKALPHEDTVVTIVERSTGEVRVIKTGASAASIVAQIMKIQAAPVVS